MKTQPKLIAVVGGSGAGKSWLAQGLQEALGLPVTRLSLDDFYRDQSHLKPSARARLNFDHPRLIDWQLAETVLLDCRAGRTVRVPRYSFVTHTRRRAFKSLTPKSIILVDGLWLLRRPRVRRLFHYRIFLQCPARLRLERRLARDIAHRGRNADSVRRQFLNSVAPMHKQFVAPQSRWADVVLRDIPGPAEIKSLATAIRKMAGAGVGRASTRIRA